MRRPFFVGAFAVFAATVSGCLQEPSSPGRSDLRSRVVNADGLSTTANDLAPNATGLCLVEIVEIVEYDETPGDGNQGVRVKLRKIKGSGEFREIINIVISFGGLTSGLPPEPPDFLRPDTFQTGNQYWIAFASIHEFEKHPQGVVNFWQKGKNVNVDAVLDRAVEADDYRWSPRYDPKTQLVYGWMIDEKSTGDEKHWRIRVIREGKVLWEKVISGTMSPNRWTLDEHASWVSSGKVPQCGKVLVAETATHLGPNNEFGLSPKTVYVRTVYDPETGVRLSARVRRHQDGDVLLLHREYDPETGEVEKETR